MSWNIYTDIFDQFVLGFYVAGFKFEAPIALLFAAAIIVVLFVVTAVSAIRLFRLKKQSASV